MVKECIFEGCEKPSDSWGLCAGHANQKRKGQELRPLKVYKKFVAPAPGKKICTRCERILDASEDFSTRVTGTKQSWCKKCSSQYNSDWQRRNRTKGGGDD